MIADSADLPTVPSHEDSNSLFPHSLPHPLDQLSTHEINVIRDVVLQARLPASVIFRNITLDEPAKKDLLPFLTFERDGELNDETLRPPRLARVLYDIVTNEPNLELCDSVVNVETRGEVSFDIVEKQYHAPLTGFVYALSYGL